MPARRFFIMSLAAKKVYCREMIQAVDVQLVSICRGEYAKELRRGYEDQLFFLNYPDKIPVADPIEEPTPESFEQKTAFLKDRLKLFKQVHGVAGG